MIWLLLAVMAVGTAAFLAPALLSDPPGEDDAEVASYFAQIDAIEADADIPEGEAEAAIATLKAQILARQSGRAERGGKGAAALILAATIAIGAGVYLSEGQPGLATAELDRQPDPRVALEQQRRQLSAQTDAEEFAQLVETLEERLRTDRADDPEGWAIYARILANTGRLDEAVAAYDRLLELTENDPEVVARRDAVVAAREAASAPGPTAEDVETAANLSDADRAAMIQGMVDGLAARLADDPADPEGWVRLIRARMVMGDEALLQETIEALAEAYSNDEQTLDTILRRAGYTLE